MQNETRGPVYLIDSLVAEEKRTPTPKLRTTRDGYTVRAGSPTSYMVRLQGEKRWRRVYEWCFSNTSTTFLRIGKVPHITRVGF